jgi:hypothetical protein
MAEGDSHKRSFGDRDSRAEILTPPETVGRDNGASTRGLEVFTGPLSYDNDATTRGLEMPTGLGKLMSQGSRDNGKYGLSDNR